MNGTLMARTACDPHLTMPLRSELGAGRPQRPTVKLNMNDNTHEWDRAYSFVPDVALLPLPGDCAHAPEVLQVATVESINATASEGHTAGENDTTFFFYPYGADVWLGKDVDLASVGSLTHALYCPRLAPFRS